MKYTVKNLYLHRRISLSGGEPSPDGTVELLEYRSLVARGDLEPAVDAHLAEGRAVGEIPPGRYLFVQGTEPEGEARTEAFRAASEEIWLEALWQEAEFKNDRILVRILSEDGKRVFQVFREIGSET